MNRAQRRIHRLLWPLLAAAIVTVFAAGLVARAPADPRPRPPEALAP